MSMTLSSGISHGIAAGGWTSTLATSATSGSTSVAISATRVSTSVSVATGCSTSIAAVGSTSFCFY